MCLFDVILYHCLTQIQLGYLIVNFKYDIFAIASLHENA